MARSKKISDTKVYVVNLTRKNIWEISDALKSMPQHRQNKVLIKDFEGFENKISQHLNEKIKNGTKDSKM